ncbi:MAG: SEC-C domain-containing protein [Candidatus Nealsonbacteria bacterium]|nr:SEC-C domain-containing protein [Candidatus Nealsonbacteria bacterium]
MSYIALNRIVEERATQDESYRRTLEQNRHPLLSHGRGMSDDELLAKLRQLGLDAQRQQIVDGFCRFVSAQAMSEATIADAGIAIPDAEVDWVWIATTCLWERWQSDVANMEMVDDKMQAGYAALKAGDTVRACRLWLPTWHAILDIIDRAEMGSLDEFDDRFGGTQSVFNWVQDYEMELHNAGLQEAELLHERISLCETMLDRFPDGELSIDSFKTALAESHFELGNHNEGERLFRVWLEETPQWGSGWIAWSDCCWLFAKPEHKDATRAEQLLQEGLALPDVENRAHMLERLQLLYKETGRDEEAEAVREEIEQAREPKTATTVKVAPDTVQVRRAFDFGDEGLPLEELSDPVGSSRSAHSIGDRSFEGQRKVGRNEPCPCGSGRKFKKCCARKPR